jgi:hypothetical protein
LQDIPFVCWVFLVHGILQFLLRSQRTWTAVVFVKCFLPWSFMVSWLFSPPGLLLHKWHKDGPHVVFFTAGWEL